jgi:O-antigen/teichoic acid export membrane protein
MRDLLLRIARTSGARVYSLIIGLIVLTITARWLGPAGRGEMAAAITWANLFFMLSYLSLNTSVLHRAAKGSLNLGKVFGTLAAFTAIVTSVGWLIAITLWWARGQTLWGPIHASVLACAFLLLPLLIWEQYGNALLISIDRLDLYNRALIIAKTISCILVVFFFLIHLGLRAAILATLLGQLGLCLAGMPEIYRRVSGKISVDWILFRELAGDGLKLHAGSVATFLYASIGTLIINRYGGAAATGIYQTATQLIEVMLVVPYATNLVRFARMGQEGVVEVWALQRRLFLLLPLLMIVLAAVAYVAAPFAIPLVVGKAFVPSVAVFRRLLPAVVFATFSGLMNSQWVGRGHFAALSLMTILCASVNLAVNFTLTKRIGIDGAILATLLSYAVLALCNIAFAIHCERDFRAKRAMNESHGVPGDVE